jgi:hypothetical protein
MPPGEPVDKTRRTIKFKKEINEQNNFCDHPYLTATSNNSR